MLKLENTEVLGWEHAIRGMRNPMNSWEKSDSLVGIGQHGFYDVDTLNKIRTGYKINGEEMVACADWTGDVGIGPNDHDLMMRLRNAGTDHRKFMRMIIVYVDITAPLYWWKEFSTYKVGTVANSCSTMHKIHAKRFEREDFSHEHLMDGGTYILNCTIDMLNEYRAQYLETKDKKYWWQMIQLLPSSYNQRRTVQMNYEVLANIYKSRKDHKLDEWHTFCDWIEGLPYSEIITGAQGEMPSEIAEKGLPADKALWKITNKLRGQRANIPGIIDDSSDISEENVGSNDGLNKHFGGCEE